MRSLALERAVGGVCAVILLLARERASVAFTALLAFATVTTSTFLSFFLSSLSSLFHSVLLRVRVCTVLRNP